MVPQWMAMCGVRALRGRVCSVAARSRSRGAGPVPWRRGIMNVPSADEIRAGGGAPRARDGGGPARRGRSGAAGWWPVVVAVVVLVAVVVAVVVVMARALSRPAATATVAAPAATAGPAAESGGAPAASGGAGGPGLVRAMGHNRTCAVSGGGVECAGRGADGEMAVQEVSGFDAPVAHLGVGYEDFATAVDSGGGVWVWAGGSAEAVARRLGALPGPVVGRVVAGALHACAVVDEAGARSVWCWGSDQWGQVSGAEGAGEVAPTRAAGVAGEAESVESSDYDTCATTSKGVWCWGLNAWGTLDKNGARILAPTRIGADSAGEGGAR